MALLYNNSNESDAHRITKNGLYEELQLHDNLDKLYFQEEYQFQDDLIADIGGYHEGKMLAVEIVHSHENYDEYKRKVNKYHNENVYDFWCYTKASLENYIDSGKTPSIMMRDLKKRFSRIYYYDVDNKELRGVCFYIEDGEYKWVVLPVLFEISFTKLLFSELKFQKYICKEEMYDVDYNLQETEEFIEYQKKKLNKNCKKEQVILNRENNYIPEFKFELDVPVQLRFVEITQFSHSRYKSIVVEIDEGCFWVRADKQLCRFFDECKGELVEVTWIKKHDPDDGQWGNRYIVNRFV